MLVRMLNMNKWDHDCIKQRKLYHGDAISDLKCSHNTLSVWQANNQEEIKEAVLALALGRDTIQKMTVVILDENTICNKYHIVIKETKEDVPITKLQDRHRDLVDIDFWNLGFIAEHIGDQLNDCTNYMIFTKGDIQKLVMTAIDSEDDLINKINPKLRNDLKLPSNGI